MVAEAHRYLYEKIVSCQYLPGQAINEKELLDETGFGRTPLREALLALQKEGLVEIFPRKGMRIAPLYRKVSRRAVSGTEAYGTKHNNRI